MMTGALPDRPYTAAEVDAAVEALREHDRLAHAEDVVTHAAPSLHRVLADALAEGGWFGAAHDAEVARAASAEDVRERVEAVHGLIAEETRLGMLVGVAVGFELAHELESARAAAGGQPAMTSDPAPPDPEEDP